jgi:hypothetical protein
LEQPGRSRAAFDRGAIGAGEHGGEVSPIVNLEKDSYSHQQFGRVWTPVPTIVDWMPLSGPEPAPARLADADGVAPGRRATTSPARRDARLSEADCSGLA